MSKDLLRKKEDETPVLKVDNGSRKQGRGVFGLFLTAIFALFLSGNIWAQTSATSITSLSDITSGTGNYIITSDITVSNTSDYPTVSTFNGTLTAQVKSDGTFPVISGLTQPLFTTVSGATISNIMLKNVHISTTGYVGAICGTANGATRIYNCGILPSNPQNTNPSTVVSTNNHCGSLVGYLDGTARVINCFSYAYVAAGTGTNIHAGGLVGYNNVATTQTNLGTMVMNCMFYGDITAGGNKYPVYGGEVFANNAAGKVNNFNYYYDGNVSFIDENTPIEAYHCSWPVSKKYLTRFEHYRSILNSNKQLCTYWITDKVYGSANAPTADDEALIAKWVLDPTIAPYPVLKQWGKYPSIINPSVESVFDPRTYTNVSRLSANAWEGKNLGSIEVTINPGSGNRSGHREVRTMIVTDMDTLNYDFCATKIQLPYYNDVFGNPDGTTWTEKYGNNYHNGKVVTGWKITGVTATGTEYTGFEPHWEHGYNFANRYCTNKDLYATSGRVFAQGGYYYVPVGVTAITIEAYWGNAVYLCNNNRRLDRVNNVNNGVDDFTVSGQLPEYVGGETNQKVKTSLSSAVDALKTIVQQSNYTVYDQAIVLVGNYQQHNFHGAIRLEGHQYDSKAKPFTIMSADFDLDNEPDFCFEVGMYNGKREPVHPIRFDFLPVPDITMAMRVDNNYYGMRIFCPQGHFEITETSFMYTTQFEYDERLGSGADYNPYHKHEAPLILNGGEFFQIVSTETGTDNQSSNPTTLTTWDAKKTTYIIMGGHLWMKAFTPGAHGNSRRSTRHCAVSVMGGEFSEFYLSGMFRTDFYNKTDNPHCYTNGGKFGLVAGAGMESVGGQNETNGGNVTFKIDRSLIREFYGGGINAARPVTGNIDVTCNNSIVHKYCGGPKLGDMSANKTITNIAVNSIFGNFYGGGNGGTNMLRDRQYDSGSAAPRPSVNTWNSTGKFNAFAPFSYASDKGYQAEYEFELLPQPSGVSTVVIRSYYHWAKFAKTVVAPVTSTLKDCTVRNDFYGGGFLGSVGGNVTSTLEGNTVVFGSAYGGGYSASIPSFPVHDKNTVHYAYADDAGYIHDGWLDYRKYTEAIGTHRVGDTIYYQWIDTDHIPASWNIHPSTSSPVFQDPTGTGNFYCYTTESLSNLGAISGNTNLTLKDDVIVYTNVFGGGNESAVTGNTEVLVNDRVKVFGNIYGGGNMGKVGGDTKVIVDGEHGTSN